MLRNHPPLSMRHISDEELLRSADGELPPQRSAEVDAHLEACWDCRARMEGLQSAITELVRSHHGRFDPYLPPISGSRALLRARIHELSAAPRPEWWKRVFQFGNSFSAAATISLLLIAMAIGSWWFRHSSHPHLTSIVGALGSNAAPDRALTPGATRQITLSEVCSVPQEEVIGAVSINLRQQVLKEYGIADARPEEYEIDYLIAPRLGGTEDIRNLWPEPYRAQVWNARVKDALEERLHELVCSGQLDLVTAQRDIATDWIAAYKKYFHTQRPLRSSS